MAMPMHNGTVRTENSRNLIANATKVKRKTALNFRSALLDCFEAK